MKIQANALAAAMVAAITNAAPLGAQDLAVEPAVVEPAVVEADVPESTGVGPTAQEACCTIPANMQVEIEIAEAVSSRTGQRGDRFAIRLAEDLLVDGITVLPAGTPGVGEIVHAARARGGGKAGELILAARYLEHQGMRVPLRSLRFGRSGQDNDNLVMALTVAGGLVGGVTALFVTGRNVDVPAGFHANARTAAEVVLGADPSSSPTS